MCGLGRRVSLAHSCYDCLAGLHGFPQLRGRIHFVRREIKPRWFDRFVTLRFQRAGFGVLPKRGSLDAILDALYGDHLVDATQQTVLASGA